MVIRLGRTGKQGGRNTPARKKKRSWSCDPSRDHDLYPDNGKRVSRSPYELVQIASVGRAASLKPILHIGAGRAAKAVKTGTSFKLNGLCGSRPPVVAVTHVAARSREIAINGGDRGDFSQGV